MQTPSHFLITAFAAVQGKKNSWVSPHLSGLLIGSFLPDVPFTLLTIAGEVWFRWFIPLPVNGMSIMEYLHFDRFFNDPLWIISHNFFHSLVINTVFLALGWWGMQRNFRWGRFLFWLAVGTTIHTMIDIPTHSSDGPLFLFPLSWTFRFSSPVSYWEAENHGWLFIVFEYTLDAILLGYFGWRWWQRNDAKSMSKRSTSGGC